MIPFHRRRPIAAALLAGAAAVLLPLPAQAQEPYPNRPIRLVVPFSPGGVTDGSARLVAEAMAKRLGQQVLVENKPGASGNIGTAQVVQAAPDGYTLLLAFDGTMVINPHVFAKVPFDTLRDFAAVGKIGDAALVLVAHPGVPAKTLQELVELSKSKPIAYGHSGIGGTPHIAGEMLAQRTGARLEHVPYKGGGPAVADAVGGNVPLAYASVAGAQGFVKSGRLRALAVSSARRNSSLPDVPTFIESGIADFVADSWVGILAPAATPPAILARLNAELNAVLNDPALRERLAVLGVEPTPGPPEAFRAQMQRDLAAYGPIVKAAGIKLE